MQVAQWRKTIGEMVRDHMRSPELEQMDLSLNQTRTKPLSHLPVDDLQKRSALGPAVTLRALPSD